MSLRHLEIRKIAPEEIDLSSLRELFKACLWDWLNDETMLNAFYKSHALYGAFQDETCIGFARTISDQTVYVFLST